ncbi:hypothetical protein NQ315_014797 [Exocentrus adspersus]|uniref:Maturase K n=1 Tax=Exocentrus adspersus TaxID=1586481 RepID=A0AAV8VM38_9CUCU|nr:hypothetical protein NQ315_014797 [Exocentrus adspersus]
MSEDLSSPYENVALGESYSIALKRFLSLEKRLSNNSFLRDKYMEIFRDYLGQGHMSKVTENNNLTAHYFIPHHAVFKIRVIPFIL